MKSQIILTLIINDYHLRPKFVRRECREYRISEKEEEDMRKDENIKYC
jgi:hypothetical protein